MRVAFTGGGTAGHYLPNIAIIEEVKKLRPDCEILYIGLQNGPEKQICKKYGILYKGIFAGKLRRYFSVNNFIDIFKLPIGLLQATVILRRFRPSIVFSKGGFVSVPVVIAAKLAGIKIIIHEGDAAPGLANKICARFADKICVTFPETAGFDPKKTILTGMPVRSGAASNNKPRWKADKPAGRKPVVLIMGGSLGAQSVNNAVFDILPKLLRRANIIHITGKGKSGIKSIREKLNNYRQIEYADEELFDFYDQSDLIVSRAGASAIAEIAAFNKPSLLIPLGGHASRGEQTANAVYMKNIGASEIIHQDENFEQHLFQKIIALINDKKRLKEMSDAGRAFGSLCKGAAGKIAKIIFGAA